MLEYREFVYLLQLFNIFFSIRTVDLICYLLFDIPLIQCNPTVISCCMKIDVIFGCCTLACRFGLGSRLGLTMGGRFGLL